MVKAIMKVHEIYREKIIFPAMVSFGYLSWAVFIIFYSFNCSSKFCEMTIWIPLPEVMLFGGRPENIFIFLLLCLNVVAIFYLLKLILSFPWRKKDNQKIVSHKEGK